MRLALPLAPALILLAYLLIWGKMQDNPGLCGTNPGHALLEGVRPVRTDFLTQLADVLVPYVKTLRQRLCAGNGGELDMYIQEGVADLLLRGGR